MSRRRQINYAQTRGTDYGDTQFPNMADNKLRLDSFRTWRGCREVDKKNLVENGFFCTEQGVSVQCYSCGVLIETWTAAMDPFLEHVRNAPYCSLLPKLQPAEFLAEIKDQIFGLDKLRVPSGIPLGISSEAFTGHRVENTVPSSSLPPRGTAPDVQSERHSENYYTHQHQAYLVAQAASGDEMDGVLTTSLT